MAKTEEQTGNIEQAQYGTRVTIFNKCRNEAMKLDRYINWAGHPKDGSYPAIILPDSSIKFFHVSDNRGSSGGVQYSCANAVGTICAWILAWHSPPDTTLNMPNKVYVTCGTKSRMDEITWEQIHQRLEDCTEKCSHEDSGTQTFANASFDDSVPGFPVLNAVFGFINHQD